MISSPASILVVEDDPSMLSALTDVLETQGYLVTQASSAEEAVHITASKQFDMIITDVRMGREDGLQAIEKVRQTQPTLGTLVVSGYASEEETLRAVSLNVGGYLKKPFKMKDFLDHVQRILEQRTKELNRNIERAALRKSLWFSWDALVQVVEELQNQSASPVPLLAGQMSQLAGSPSWLAEVIRLGLTLRNHRQLSALRTPAFLEGLKHYVGLQQLVQDGTLPGDPDRLENQLVVWAQSAQPQGNVPAALEALYQNALRAPGASPPGVRRASTQESLLTLARTLEKGGDLSNARKAYDEMLKRPLPPGEEVEALMGLARLALGEGEPEAATRLSAKAQQVGSATNLATQAKLALEHGMLMKAVGSGDAIRSIERAIQLFESIQFASGLALSRVAQAVIAPGPNVDINPSLGTLLLPENLSELAACAEWLVGGLVETGLGDPALVRRIISRCAGELAGHLEQLAPAARSGILQLFEDQSQSLPDELLQILKDDPEPTIRARASRIAVTESDAVPMLEIHSFGLFEVFTGQKHLNESGWKTQKVKFLLAYLAARGSGTEDILQELFWPDSAGGGSRKSLNHALSAIRVHLRTGLEAEPVVREGTLVRLNPQVPLWHDCNELEAAWMAAQRESAGEMRDQKYRRILTLYRGSYLEGCYMEWALEARKEVENRVSEASFQLAVRALEKSRFQEVGELCARCMGLDPHRQDALVLSMKAHTQSGRPAAAVAEYERYTRFLKNEYEAEPTMEALKEYHRARLGIA